MRTKILLPLIAIAVIFGGSALAVSVGPPLRMDSTGIVQARGFNEVDAGINVHNGDLNVVGQGPITVEPVCAITAGTTCTIADTTATEATQLICGGAVIGFTDGGTVTASSPTKCILNQGTGWTCTVSTSTTALLPCFKIN